MDSSIKRYSRQYPIGPARNIDVNIKDNSVMLKWLDPEDPILDKIYFSKWEFTRILRKKGSVPKDTWDGEIIAEIKDHNKYKDEYFVDDNITFGETYYYAIIPCSDLGKHSWDKADFIEIKPVQYDSLLENNTWETIFTMVKNRCAEKIWKVGDTKKLSLTGNINKDITMRISNIAINNKNWYECKNNYKKLALTFDTTELINDLPINIYNAIPEDLKELLDPEEDFVMNTGYESDINNSKIYTDDKSRIKTLDGTPSKYNCNEALIDETGKVNKDVGVITDTQVVQFEIHS